MFFFYILYTHLPRKGFSAHSVIRAQWHRLIFRYKSQCSHNLRNVLSGTAHDRGQQLILSLTFLPGPPQESGFGWGVFEKNYNSLAEGQTLFFTFFIMPAFGLILIIRLVIDQHSL